MFPLRIFVLLGLMSGALGMPLHARAAEEKKETQEAPPAEEEKKAAPKAAAKKEEKPKQDKAAAKKPDDSNPVQDWIAAENKLIDTLSARDKQSFYIMRNKYGVIRSVRIVRRDISNAVQACGKDNPGMKADMKNRFKAWENAVLPVIEMAEKYLEEEIETQQVVFPSDFRHVLDLNDKAYEFGEKHVEKTPVTTEEACEGLLDSMDRTEDRMVELLQDMLLPESVILERAARAEAEEKASKEASEKESEKKETEQD